MERSDRILEKASTILNSTTECSSKHFKLWMKIFIISVVFTLARRCLFIAPTPPGPLRILKLELSP